MLLRVAHNGYHNALGLPRGATDVTLWLMSGLMMLPLHAVKVTHLEHHKHCLGELDIEGEAGRTVRYDCPEPRHHSNVDLIAKLENDDVVHWTGVAVDESGEGKVVREQGAAGVPADMSPEEVEILAQQRGITVEEVIAEVASAPRPTKSSVVFRPNYAPWIELELQGKRTVQLVLEAKKTKALPAGTYTVSFRTREGAEWTKAEVPLELEAGKSYDVEMVSRPPFMKITVK